MASTVTEKGNSAIWCLSEPVSSAGCKLLFLLPFHLKITGICPASAFNKGQCKYTISIICMFKYGARPNVSHPNCAINESFLRGCKSSQLPNES